MLLKPIFTIAFLFQSLVAHNQQTDSLLNQKQLRDQKVYTDLKKALKHPEKVYSLNLDGQGLDSLPETIGLLVNLQALSISIGPKPDLPKRVLKKAKNIGGGIYHLDRGTGRYVGSNNLTKLPASFTQLTKLQYLDLGYNEFEDLPVDFSVFSQLKVLKLQGCRGLIDNLEEVNALKAKMPAECKVMFIDDEHDIIYWWPF